MHIFIEYGSSYCFCECLFVWYSNIDFFFEWLFIYASMTSILKTFQTELCAALSPNKPKHLCRILSLYPFNIFTREIIIVGHNNYLSCFYQSRG